MVGVHDGGYTKWLLQLACTKTRGGRDGETMRCDRASAIEEEGTHTVHVCGCGWVLEATNTQGRASEGGGSDERKTKQNKERERSVCAAAGGDNVDGRVGCAKCAMVDDQGRCGPL